MTWLLELQQKFAPILSFFAIIGLVFLIDYIFELFLEIATVIFGQKSVPYGLQKMVP